MPLFSRRTHRKTMMCKMSWDNTKKPRTCVHNIAQVFSDTYKAMSMVVLIFRGRVVSFTAGVLD
jgi:hypothetical protein